MKVPSEERYSCYSVDCVIDAKERVHEDRDEPLRYCRIVHENVTATYESIGHSNVVRRVCEVDAVIETPVRRTDGGEHDRRGYPVAGRLKQPAPGVDRAAASRLQIVPQDGARLTP